MLLMVSLFLEEFMDACIIITIAHLTTLFIFTCALKVFTVSCLLDDSVLLQEVVLPLNYSVHFETNLL